MPIYEYRCTACDHELEILQKLSDPELSNCPACGQAELKKLMSAVGFRLKGSGWYETDFKNSSQKKNVAKDDGAPASDSTSAPACDGAGGCGTCATTPSTAETA